MSPFLSKLVLRNSEGKQKCARRRSASGVRAFDPEAGPRALQVQRVIHNLAKEWVLTEAALLDLSPADLRRLDVPAAGIS